MEQRSGEALALGGGCGDGGDCGRLSGAAEWRFGEASTLDGRRLAHRAREQKLVGREALLLLLPLLPSATIRLHPAATNAAAPQVQVPAAAAQAD